MEQGHFAYRHPLSRPLTAEEVEAFGRELDGLRDRTRQDLGQRDADYIRGIIRKVRATEVGGRLLLHVSFTPVGIGAGIACLSFSKILENMEVGHNVMHGQYDWTNDPALTGNQYEWDITCEAAAWREYHNYEHHTFTNIIGKDRDFGYSITRLAPEQPWRPYHLFQPFYNVVHALAFEWGVGLFALELDKVVAGQSSRERFTRKLKGFLRKAGRQIGKDYVFFPLLAGPGAPKVLAGNFTANLVRNLWTYGIIFCGHFTEDIQVFSQESTEQETRGQWYLRQLHGSSNLEGSRSFHILTGHLSHQIEHHLFPDIPAHRYPELAVQVRAICERYGQHYNTGPVSRQFGSVVKRILKYSLPFGHPEQSRKATSAPGKRSASLFTLPLRKRSAGAEQLAG